jgi:hypothetical protein
MNQLHVLVVTLILSLAWVTNPQLLAEAQTIADEKRRIQAVNIAGMQVFIDAETGRLRPPTIEERQQLAEALRKTFARQPHEMGATYRHPNGMLSHVVGPEHVNFSIATVSAEGNLNTKCVNGPEQAKAYIEVEHTTHSEEE